MYSAMNPRCILGYEPPVRTLHGETDGGYKVVFLKSQKRTGFIVAEDDVGSISEEGHRGAFARSHGGRRDSAQNLRFAIRTHPLLCIQYYGWDVGWASWTNGVMG
jgi:hypothetical protein